MPKFFRPLTDEQKKTIEERQKPAQDDINQAANDLIWQLMQDVEQLKKERDKP